MLSIAICIFLKYAVALIFNLITLKNGTNISIFLKKQFLKSNIKMHTPRLQRYNSLRSY